MKPVVSAKEKPSAALSDPQPSRSDPSRPASPQTSLRVRYFRRMNVQRVYPLTVETPTLRPGQSPPPVVESVVVRPVIPGALVVPSEQKLDPNRPGATAKFHITPLALGWLPDARVEVHHPGRPVQQIPLGSPPTSWVVWVILLVLFFPIVVPLRLLLGPWGGTPRVVSQRPTWIMLFLAVILPILLLTFTRYAPMRGEITLPITGPDRDDGKVILPAQPPPMPPMPMLGGNPGHVLFTALQEEPPKQPPGKKQPAKKQPAADPMEGAGKDQEAAVPAAVDPPSRTHRVVRDFSDQPGELLRDRLETLFKEQLPQLPVLRDTVYPGIASGLGVAYGLLCDKNSQQEFHPSFWLFVFLLLFTGLTWVARTSYQTTTRKVIDLTPRVSDAEAIETLPLSPQDRVPGLQD